MFKKSIVCAVMLLTMHAYAADSEQPSKEKACVDANEKYEACMDKHGVAGRVLCVWRLRDAVLKCEEASRERAVQLPCTLAGMTYQMCLMSCSPSAGKEAMEKCMPHLQDMIEKCKKSAGKTQNNTEPVKESNA